MLRALLALLFFTLTVLPVRGEIVPQYNLTGPEQEIVVSWLFEQGGYLDAAVNSFGVSARQASDLIPGPDSPYLLDPFFDGYQWQRANVKGPKTAQSDWEEVAMVWWIWKHNGVNVTPPQRPPESALWISRLQEWAASIDSAFISVNSVARNANTVPITDEAGTVTTMPAGTQLIHQRSMFDKVIGVLQ